MNDNDNNNVAGFGIITNITLFVLLYKRAV